MREHPLEAYLSEIATGRGRSRKTPLPSPSAPAAAASPIAMARAIKIENATIIVDITAGTLQPKSHEDGMLLGVGYGADDTRKMERQKALREEAIDLATEQHGMPEFGWVWHDHNGVMVHPR